MPETVHCSNCQAPFTIPDALLGRKVKCPACGGVFTAGRAVTAEPEPPAESVPPVSPWRDGGKSPEREPRKPAETAWDNFVREWAEPADDEDSARPRRERPAVGTDVWANLATGARLYAVAHALYGCALLLLLLFAIATLDSPSGGRGWGGPPTMLIVAAIVAGLALLANWLLALVAACFWVLAPARAGARALAIALLVVSGLVLQRFLGVFGLFGDPMHRWDRASEEYWLATLVFTSVLEMTRLLLLGFFLHAVAINLGKGSFLSRTRALAIGTPCVQLGLFALNMLAILVAASTRSGGGVGVLLVFVNIFGQAALLLWGLLVLQRAGRALRNAAVGLEPVRS
jgi:predicted Zn finger-like uncharacterized protein